jgi:hypothetical protein
MLVVALMSCFLQDDLKKFVSEPPPPPQEVEIPEEGKTTRRRYRTASNCDRGSAVLTYLMFLSFRINRLAWRPVWPHRRRGRAIWPASAWRRS